MLSQSSNVPINVLWGLCQWSGQLLTATNAFKAVTERVMITWYQVRYVQLTTAVIQRRIQEFIQFCLTVTMAEY